MANPIVTITMENGDVMKAELYPDIAPNTVNNFISLVKKGFYDEVIFHRVIKGFMIQGGDPQGIGIGGPGYSIKGEFAQNGFKNDLAHTPGVLSMARSMMPDSAGSQFFIMHANAPHLDGDHHPHLRYHRQRIDHLPCAAAVLHAVQFPVLHRLGYVCRAHRRHQHRFLKPRQIVRHGGVLAFRRAFPGRYHAQGPRA